MFTIANLCNIDVEIIDAESARSAESVLDLKNTFEYTIIKYGSN